MLRIGVKFESVPTVSFAGAVAVPVTTSVPYLSSRMLSVITAGNALFEPRRSTISASSSIALAWVEPAAVELVASEKARAAVRERVAITSIAAPIIMNSDRDVRTSSSRAPRRLGGRRK